jgi:hypothetical protein
MGRATDRAMKVGPYTVPAGTIVGTPLFAIHNTKHNWEAPWEFRPERWADVPVESYVYDSKAAAHGGKRGITFMPFRRAGGRSAAAQAGWEDGERSAAARAGRSCRLGSCKQASRWPSPLGPWSASETTAPASVAAARLPGCLTPPPTPAPRPRLPSTRSEGPRNCVGQSLAKMEVMTLLAKLLGSFEIGGLAAARAGLAVLGTRLRCAPQRGRPGR